MDMKIENQILLESWVLTTEEIMIVILPGIVLAVVHDTSKYLVVILS